MYMLTIGRFYADLIIKHQLYKVRDAVTTQKDLTNIPEPLRCPACDSEVQDNTRKARQRRFGSGICGHVSVW